jgi:hypothetical protein
MFNNYELTFAVWTISVILTIQFKFSIYFLKLLLVFFVIFLIAFFSTFNNDYGTFFIFRDIAYLLKPILGLLIGYQIFKKIKTGFLETLIVVGLAMSIIHLFIILWNMLILNTLSFYILRDFGGYHNDYEVFVLIMLLFHKKLNLNFSIKQIKIFTLIVAVSSILYFSRINFIMFFVLFFALKGYFILNQKSFKIISFFVLFVGLGYFAIYQYNPKRTDKGIDSILYKIKNAPIEPFKTKIKIDDYKDFNDNFRSYENLKTLEQVFSSGYESVIFGKGLGSTIDYGRRMYTTDGSYIRQAPTLHNGFATIFLKSGLLGFLLLIYSIYLMFQMYKTNNEQLKYINYLFLGTGFYLIMSYWVFMGFYLKLDNKVLFLGYLIAYREYFQKKLTI